MEFLSMSRTTPDRDHWGLPMLSNLRKWGLWQDSRSVIAFLLTVDLATMIAVSAALASGTADLSAFRRALILIALAMLFEETSRTVDRLRFRITEGVYVDMTSVWLVASAIVLPAAYAVIVVVVVRGHMWFRHQRRIGMHAYRQLFTATSNLQSPDCPPRSSRPSSSSRAWPPSRRSTSGSSPSGCTSR